MKISSFKYSLSDAVKSLKRNRSLTTASIATVMATLLIMGVFLLVTENLKLAINGISSQLQVKISLNDDASLSQQNDIKSKINEVNGIKGISMETKDEALNNLKKQVGDANKGILAGLDEDNPLPNSFVVTVEKPEVISKVVSNVKGMPGIYEIQDGREIVNKVIYVVNTIKWIGIALFVILILVSLFLIGNTIRLTVYSRRREINIMKFIGATDWFIRIPFILEGMTIGVIGAVLSNIILFIVYQFISNKAIASFPFLQLISPYYILTNFMFEFMISGMLIGALGSVMAVRKFLTA